METSFTPLSTEERVVNRLIQKNWHIACAESCTGGLVAATLINVANASRVLNASFVTYANEAKTKYAHVSADTIARFGVVSEEVVREMAEGVARETGSETGIGISGIAGPAGGSKEQPVGMVCFGFYINGTTVTETMKFSALGRNVVRNLSTQYALERLLELL